MVFYGTMQLLFGFATGGLDSQRLPKQYTSTCVASSLIAGRIRAGRFLGEVRRFTPGRTEGCPHRGNVTERVGVELAPGFGNSSRRRFEIDEVDVVACISSRSHSPITALLRVCPLS